MDWLLHKLYYLGVGGKLLRFIESYFTNRTQIVQVGDVLSDSRPVASGVPQGSVLAALFFIIYVTVLPEVSISSLTLLLADGAKFLSINFSNSNFQIVLSRVSKWS